jgi:hypothetical protein
MEIEEVNTSFEQRICYLFATNDEYIEEVAGKWQRGLLSNKYCEKLVALCVKYYNKYGKAPQDNLPKFIASAVALKKLDADTVAELQLIMQGFQTADRVTDVDFEVGETLKYFETQAIKLVSEEAQALVAKGDVTEARELLTNIESFQRSKLDGCDVYALDDNEIEDAVNDTYEQLIELPGAVGKVMNNTLVRGGFITFMARMKVGKTHWLTLLARYARKQGRKVIFFSAGDMTKHQMLMRVWQADARTTANKNYLNSQRVPYLDCIRNQKGTCFDREGDGNLLNEWNEVDPYFENKPEYKPCTLCMGRQDDKKRYEKAMSYKRVQRPLLDAEMVRNLRDKARENDNGGVLHIEHAPSGTLTCDGRRSRIHAICKQYGWEHPDVIIYDYAGLMANEKKDERESTHFVWQSMRAEADPEMFNCLVITAMQANSSSFDFNDLSIRSFSLDKRCFDEVSAAFALNQVPDERKEGITRIAALLKREHPFDECMQAECHGCLSLGTPLIVSDIVFRDPPKQTGFTK